MDLTATDAAELTGLSVRATNTIYLKVRQRIAQNCEAQNPFQGEVEIDESYFGPKRIRGKRGRGAGGKTIVFGIFKRNGRVYTEIVPDCRKNTLQKAIRGRVDLQSIVHSDGWRGYDGLVDVGYDAEHHHEHLRETLGIRSLIPPTRGRPTSKRPTGKWRRLMKRLFKNVERTNYGQRWQVESVFSMIKRNLGDAVHARSYHAQCRELLLKAVTHNVMVAWLTEVFYRAHLT